MIIFETILIIFISQVMMKRTINILTAVVTLIATSCSSDTLPDTIADNGEKSPLAVQASLSNGNPVSRAADKTFAVGDSLWAYIRQVTWDGTEVADYSPESVVTGVAADHSPRLVLFTVDADFGMTPVDANTEQTGDITPDASLFWDDFSDSSSPATDLRTTGHYLQSAWGFCYNGGTPTTALEKSTGTVGWTAAADFADAATLRKNDLLWAKAQKPIAYNRNALETLKIPYTHAMSMITIEVAAADGFAAGVFGSTEAKLYEMYETAVFAAPNATVGGQAGSQSVKMLAGSEGTNAGGLPVKTFQALVIPGKELTIGSNLATITDIEGNNYNVPLTTEILDAWRAHLESGTKLKSGVNYMLKLTVRKQGITVVAQITDWSVVEATGEGEIKFTADVTASGVTNELTEGSFYLYRGELTDDLAKVTTATFSVDKWVNTPEIYWANGSTGYYFRALATTADGSKLTTPVGSIVPAQDNDLLWATTKEHSGTDADGNPFSYATGAKIAPRTGDVPLQFEHAMSKITIVLSTSTTGKASPTDDEVARAVDLTGAQIRISNLSTVGTIAIADGAITPVAIDAEVPDAITGGENDVAETSQVVETDIAGKIVVPQRLDDATYSETLFITLADGTVYKLLLKSCLVKDSATPIDEWKRGTHYVYNIYLEKESVRFVAVLKEWNMVEGGGNANLDWD